MVIISALVLIDMDASERPRNYTQRIYYMGGLFCIVCTIYLTDSCNPFDFLDHPAKLLPHVSFIGFPEYFV